ncbi:hypothetical protein D3C80_1252700 [compost metagenome]
MDENCLRQFKVGDSKFGVGLAQPAQGGLQSDTVYLAVAGDKRGGIILGIEQQFAIEGRRGHLAGDVTADDKIVGGEVHGLGSTGPAQHKQQ